MVHVVPQSVWRRRIDRLVGIFIILLGVVVAVVAVIALHQPNGHRAAAATSKPTSPSGSAGASPTPSASTSASASGSAHASSSASTSRSVTGTATTSHPVTIQELKALPLMVLNNTSKIGLATTAEQRFTSAGWTVQTTGNLSNDIISTCAYYDPNVTNSHAAATALQQEFPAIKRVVPRFSGLPSGPIVVVLTSDYS